MPNPPKNIPIGTKFERLTVIKQTRNQRGKLAWECLCECGKTTVVFYSNLVHKKIRSCGCLHKDLLKARGKLKIGSSKYKKFKDEWIELYIDKNLTCRAISLIYKVPEPAVNWILIKNLKKLERGRNRKYSCNEEYFSDIDTEDKAYWLGFITADGNVSKGGYCLSIHLATRDIEHLEKFKRSIASNHPITTAKRKAFNKLFSGSTISIGSKKICEDLQTLGVMANKSYIVKPAIIPKHLESHYWRGVIDGDGSLSLYPNKALNLTLIGNKFICAGFKDFVFRTFGYTGVIKKHNNGDCYTISFYCKKAFMISSLLYSKYNISLSRKLEKWKTSKNYLNIT